MFNKITLIFITLFLPILSYSQKINRFKNKERHGKWIIYTDSTQKQIDNIGRYRKGVQKGTWKYYNEKGILVKQDKYRFRKIITSYYHPNGKIQKQGKSKIVQEGNILHFFYYGDWLVYDTTGSLIKKQVYERGMKISEVEYKTSAEKNINDSLVLVLRTINQTIYKYHDSVNLAEKAHGKSSFQYQRAVSLNALHTSKLLDEISNIIAKYGYPGKTLVGSDYAIVFSIISLSNKAYKEKYYDIIIDAANKGELDWSDVAFFVDKVKVAKNEKQIYGTQYKLDVQQNKFLFYPIEEIDKVNDRRKKVGLKELNLLKLSFCEY